MYLRVQDINLSLNYMSSVCLYFHIHQPYRLKRYRVFDIGTDHAYFNDVSESDCNNEKIFKRVTDKSYIPTARLLLDLLQQHSQFRVSFSITGTVLDQFEQYNPGLVTLFRAILNTGQAEILGETYHHSLAFFHSLSEFDEQVSLHKKKIQKLFGVTPSVLRNTELAYTNTLANWAENKGYKGIITEGWEYVLGERSPNFVYRPTGTRNIKLLLKNYRLSDDIAFRFGERSWSGWPLCAPKFASWVSAINGNGETVNLFMDFETFGEHQWGETGIFDFLRQLPYEILKNPDNNFMTPSEVIDSYPVRGEVDVPHILTWADTERDLTAWNGNDMQREALQAVYALEDDVLHSEDPRLIEDWRRLQTSDHFYYMCTKWFSDGDVHAYFSPYNSPYEAFITYMNIMKDMNMRSKAPTRLVKSAINNNVT